MGMVKSQEATLFGTGLAVALLSLSALFLEVSLAHFLTVLYYPPAVYAVLTLAILGIGVGAALAAWYPTLRRVDRVHRYLFAAAVCVLLFIGSAVSFVFPWVQNLLWFLVILPFLFTGLSFAALFSHAAQESPRLYQADLTGAGFGALLAIPLLNLFGGLNGLIFAAVLFAAAGMSVWRRSAARRSGLLLILGVGLTLAGFGLSRLEIPLPYTAIAKPAGESLSGTNSVLLHSRWDAFARTDLIDPGDGGPYRMYTNGAAGSVVPPVENNEFLWRDIGFFPFATEQPERVFIAGPGGGLDVWFAVQANARAITAVEVNPAAVALVNEIADYHGDLFARPEVSVYLDEARSFLRRKGETYDLIFLSHVVTQSAERSGYALVENGAFTREAFQEYFDHLAPDGQLGLKLYDEPTLTRALATALAEFNRRGLPDREALQHVVVLLDTRVQPAIPLLIVQKSPFSESDSLSIGAVADRVGFKPLFLPGVLADPPLDRVQAGSISYAEVLTSLPGDYTPTTDDRPFFYEFERGIPSSLFRLAVPILLFVAGFCVFLYRMQRSTPRGVWQPSALYFAALGLGFMLVEIAVLQQVRLYLGHPTTSVTVVLATLLIGGGIGSGLSEVLFPSSRTRLPVLPALATVAALAAWSLAWPWLGDRFLHLETWGRVLVVVTVLLPVGALMGMSFPLGLQIVGRFGTRQVASAWAVNGVMTVAGSVLAVVLAVELGFTIVMITGSLAYAFAAGVAALSSHVFQIEEEAAGRNLGPESLPGWEKSLTHTGD